MIYSYKVKKTRLTNTEKKSLLGGDEVISQHSPRQLQNYHCADFQFPNGDTFPLKQSAVRLESAEASE